MTGKELAEEVLRVPELAGEGEAYKLAEEVVALSVKLEETERERAYWCSLYQNERLAQASRGEVVKPKSCQCPAKQGEDCPLTPDECDARSRDYFGMPWFGARLRRVFEGFERESLNGVVCSIPDSGLNTPPHRTWCVRCQARYMELKALVEMLESTGKPEPRGEVVKTQLCPNGVHEWSNPFGDDWTPEEGNSCDCGQRQWGVSQPERGEVVKPLSGQPCGCDPTANWTCERHATMATHHEGPSS